MEKKLTFILPIYNVEAYLPQCIDSILEQADESCELILVDDGAKDSSGAICDRYQQDHPEIKVIHKPNGGLSSARNAGMELAEGTYVCFVDSDDYLAPGSVKKLLEWIDGNSCDLCFLQTIKVYPDGSECPMGDGLTRQEIRGKSREQVLHFLAGCSKFPGSAWGKLWKRAFLEANDFRFPLDRRLSEDLIYCLEAFQAAQSFDCLEFPFYCYRQNRPGSITNVVTARYYFDTGLFVEEMARRYPQGKTDSASECALSYGAYEYSILLWQARLLPREDQQRAWSWLRQYRWVLRYAVSRKTRMVNVAVSVLGLKNTAKLLDYYQNHRN